LVHLASSIFKQQDFIYFAAAIVCATAYRVVWMGAILGDLCPKHG